MLVAVYGVFALAATSRAAVQIATDFHEAPLAYLLSAFSAVVYVIATVALAGGDWRRVALVAVSIELVGVLVVGTVSLLAPGTSRGRPSGRATARATASCRWCCRSPGCGGCAAVAHERPDDTAPAVRLMSCPERRTQWCWTPFWRRPAWVCPWSGPGQALDPLPSAEMS